MTDHNTIFQYFVVYSIQSIMIYTKNTKKILYNRMYRIHMYENMKVDGKH